LVNLLVSLSIFKEVCMSVMKFQASALSSITSGDPPTAVFVSSF
jgi:hypothetical protein